MATVLRLTQAKMGWAELPGLILVGHSLGGAVVVDVAKWGKLGNAVLGYAVLDVVEGMFTRTCSEVYATMGRFALESLIKMLECLY